LWLVEGLRGVMGALFLLVYIVPGNRLSLFPRRGRFRGRVSPPLVIFLVWVFGFFFLAWCLAPLLSVFAFQGLRGVGVWVHC